MALKDIWTDKTDDVDYILGDDINAIAHEVISNSENKADKTTVYTKSETDTILSTKADKATTYTATETDDMLSTKVDKADLDWELIGEAAITDVDISSGAVNALTVGNDDGYILDGVSEIMMKIYVPISSTVEGANDYNKANGSIRIGFAKRADWAAIIGNASYEILKSQGTTFPPIYYQKANRITIFINFFNQVADFAQINYAIAGAKGYPTTTFSVTQPTGAKTNEGKYLTFNSGMSNPPFNFPAGSTMKVYARRNINETAN